MEDEDRKHSFFIKLKEGWTTNVPKTLKSKNNITIVYKGSSITLDEIMYLNEKEKKKQSPKQRAPPIKIKSNFLRKM